MKFRNWTRTLAALTFVVMATRAEAGLLPVSATPTLQQDGNTRYTYGVVLTSDSTLKTGDYFTIYDFAGLVPQSNVQPANFTLSVSNVGRTPPGTVPANDATLPDLTWTYTGAATLIGQTGLNNFSVVSTNAPSQTTTEFTALTHRQIDGQPDSNITETLVPGSGSAITTGVPEPATLALFAIGLPFAAFVRRRRQA